MTDEQIKFARILYKWGFYKGRIAEYIGYDRDSLIYLNSSRHTQIRLDTFNSRCRILQNLGVPVEIINSVNPRRCAAVTIRNNGHHRVETELKATGVWVYPIEQIGSDKVKKIGNGVYSVVCVPGGKSVYLQEPNSVTKHKIWSGQLKNRFIVFILDVNQLLTGEELEPIVWYPPNCSYPFMDRVLEKKIVVRGIMNHYWGPQRNPFCEKGDHLNVM